MRITVRTQHRCRLSGRRPARREGTGPLDPGPRPLPGLACVPRGVGFTSGVCLPLVAPDSGRDLLSWVTFVPVADQLRELVTWACM